MRTGGNQTDAVTVEDWGPVFDALSRDAAHEDETIPYSEDVQHVNGLNASAICWKRLPAEELFGPVRGVGPLLFVMSETL